MLGLKAVEQQVGIDIPRLCAINQHVDAIADQLAGDRRADCRKQPLAKTCQPQGFGSLRHQQTGGVAADHVDGIALEFVGGLFDRGTEGQRNGRLAPGATGRQQVQIVIGLHERAKKAAEGSDHGLCRNSGGEVVATQHRAERRTQRRADALTEIAAGRAAFVALDVDKVAVGLDAVGIEEALEGDLHAVGGDFLGLPQLGRNAVAFQRHRPHGHLHPVRSHILPAGRIASRIDCGHRQARCPAGEHFPQGRGHGGYLGDGSVGSDESKRASACIANFVIIIGNASSAYNIRIIIVDNLYFSITPLVD